MIMDIDPVLLRAFVAVSETSGFTRAARRLNLTQPAVSHHLALLKMAGILDCRRDGKHNFYRLVPRRCQDYLNVVFGVSGDQTRRVRVDEAVLTYGRAGE